MTLPETFSLLLTLFGADPTSADVLGAPVPRPEVSSATAYAVLDVEGRSLALTFTPENGRIVFLELIGDANPEEELGNPTYKWVDAMDAARAWSEASGARLLDDRGTKWRLFFPQDGARPSLLMSFGPGFPQGEWTDDTRGLKVTLTAFGEDDAKALE